MQTTLRKQTARKTDTSKDQNSLTIRQCFDKYDQDGNGVIDRDELQKLCSDMGFLMNNSEALIILQLLDIDGNGTICYSEFLEW